MMSSSKNSLWRKGLRNTSNSMKIVFVLLVNRADPDKILNFTAFHLCLHYLQSTHLGVSNTQSVNMDSHPSWKIVWILVIWLVLKPGKLDLHCFLERINACSTGPDLIYAI